MTKRAPRRCRKCGHEPRSEEWSSFHVEPADAVRPCARKHERNLPQNRAAPASYCTVPPDQRKMAPGVWRRKADFVAFVPCPCGAARPLWLGARRPRARDAA